jgi:hypothetical protein
MTKVPIVYYSAVRLPVDDQGCPTRTHWKHSLEAGDHLKTTVLIPVCLYHLSPAHSLSRPLTADSVL